MAQSFNLKHFEKIDGLHGSLIRLGDFLTCADPRGYISLSNRLLDACLDAGMSHDTPSHEGWASEYLCRALVSA